MDEVMELQWELFTLREWFKWYDEQVMQYGRCLRTGEEYDKDIAALDTEAAAKQERIRAIQAELEGY